MEYQIRIVLVYNPIPNQFRHDVANIDIRLIGKPYPSTRHIVPWNDREQDY